MGWTIFHLCVTTALLVGFLYYSRKSDILQKQIAALKTELQNEAEHGKGV